MFKELAPLLQDRSVTILVNPLEGETLRVIVMPKRLNDNESAALSTPVSISGTPAEIDEQLPSTLTQFVGAHLDLKNTLEIAKEEMAQAAKAARQSAKAKPAAKPEPSDTPAAKGTETKPAKAPTKPAEPKKVPPPATGNLFDFGTAPAPAPAAVAPRPQLPVPAAVEPPDDEIDGNEEFTPEVSDDERTDENLDSAA